MYGTLLLNLVMSFPVSGIGIRYRVSFWYRSNPISDKQNSFTIVLYFVVSTVLLHQIKFKLKIILECSLGYSY